LENEAGIKVALHQILLYNGFRFNLHGLELSTIFKLCSFLEILSTATTAMTG